MLITPAGIVTLVIELQPLNAKGLTHVTPVGIVTLVRELQL